MMTTAYARVQDNIVAELFETDLDIKGLFHPDLIWVDVSAERDRPSCGWSAVADGGRWIFSKPETPAPDIAQLAAKRDGLMSEAANRIGPLSDCVELGIATDQEVEALRRLRQYRVELMRLDVSNPSWPTPPF